MTDTAIQIRELGKRYRLGGAAPGRTLPESVAHTARSLAARLRGGAPSAAAPAAASGGEFWALRDINLDIPRGEVVGVIGRNGAGKSTLLKVLSRITDPTEGRAALRGRVASLLEVGTGFHPELTGRENIYLNGAILGMSRREVRAKFGAIVDFAEVERFLDTPVKHYSSGMYVRLAFAVAAHLEPEILIVDEVLAVGDAAFQEKCLGRMREVGRGGRTVLFVSHNMAAVQGLTGRCLWLDQGRLVEDGEPGAVINRYLGAQRATDADTSLAPRSSPHLGQDARILRVTPRPADAARFRFGEDLHFDAVIRSRADLRGLRLGVTVCELGGAPVLTAITPQNLNLAAGGEATVRLRMDRARLAPGTYSLALSVGRGGRTEARAELDVVREGPVFSIDAATVEGDALFNWRRDYGPLVHDLASAEPITFDHQHKAA